MTVTIGRRKLLVALGGAAASDLVLRNVNTGQLEVYNISNNQITGAALNAVLADSKTKQRLADMGGTVAALSVAELGKFVGTEKVGHGGEIFGGQAELISGS